MATLHRRICVLRASGRNADADRLAAGDFTSARAAAETYLSETLSLDAADFLPALLAAEETRVADALVLAELLAPLLAERLRPLPALGAAPSPSHSAVPSVHRPASPVTRSGEAPSIADLIDGMLGQEHAPDRGR